MSYNLLKPSGEEIVLLRSAVPVLAYRAFLAWVGLSLSYNAYKAYIRWHTSAFPIGLKVEIKSAFPSAIVFFVSVHLIRHVLSRNAPPGWKGSLLLLAAYAGLLNTLAFSYSREALIALNGSVILIPLLAALLVFLRALRQFFLRKAEAWGVLPESSAEKAKAASIELLRDISDLPSGLIAAGTACFLLTPLLILLKEPGAASHAASAAYALILGGAVFKLLRLRKGGNEGG